MTDQMFPAPMGRMPYDAYLEIDGISGESQDTNHTDWIEVKQYRHKVDQKVGATFSAGAPTCGQADHGYFWVCKEVDKATPDLAEHLLKGQAIASAILEFCTAAGDKTCFMKVEMKNLVVASQYIAGAEIPPSLEGIPFTKPCEWVAFAYSEIIWTYTQLDPTTGAPKGDISKGWSRTTNQPA